jgi:hypothetical protein
MSVIVPGYTCVPPLGFAVHHRHRITRKKHLFSVALAPSCFRGLSFLATKAIKTQNSTKMPRFACVSTSGFAVHHRHTDYRLQKTPF